MADPPVRPWPGQNPPSQTPSTTQKNQEQRPIQVYVPPQQEESSGNSGNNPMQQVLPLMQQMMGGGRSEFAGGGNSGGINSGVSSSLDMGGYGGTGPGNVSLVNINGCSRQPGKFQFVMADYPAGGCDGSVKMHEDMANFMNNQMARCVVQAAGTNSFNFGKIYHAGTMGDEAHQRTMSLHNYGLAIDVKAIQIDNKVFVYDHKDPASQAFFSKLRQCWGDAAQRERNGCLPQRSSGMPQGSIGDEDSRHGHHLHLSLPMCREVAGGANIAWFWQMLWSVAHAEETKDAPLDESKYLPPPSTFTRKTQKIPNGVVNLTIEDTHGEPLAADHIISLEYTCMKEPKAKALGKTIEACAFESFRYNSKSKGIEVYYRKAVMYNGRVSCRKREVTKIPVSCEASLPK